MLNPGTSTSLVDHPFAEQHCGKGACRLSLARSRLAMQKISVRR